MTDTVIFIFELAGTVAFAVSGATVAIEKKMDIFGVIILGLTTSIGGGILRDLLLGISPPSTFQNPAYAVTAICVSVIIFLPSVRNILGKNQRFFGALLLVIDSLGLGIFTMVGVQTAFHAASGGLFLTLFVGVVTGVGGGIMRDVMAGNTPYVFVKHFYACASLLGAISAVVLWQAIGEMTAMLTGAAVTVILRFLAAKYRWKLPRAK